MANISITNDTLFFSSNRPGTFGGMDIWRSIKVNGLWQEPMNLGDSINTINDELKPYYTNTSRELYFERMSTSPYLIEIYKSNMLGEQWQQAERLPDVINLPGFRTVGPFFDELENALYFTNYNPQLQDIDNIKKSILTNNIWQEPIELTTNINGFYTENFCNRVTTECIFISSDRQLAFYDKWIWEQSMCIDFWCRIFLSESFVSIDEVDTGNTNKFNNSLKIYPNPSNSVFTFSMPLNLKESEMSIYNIKGQKLRSFSIYPSTQTVFWDGKNSDNISVSSGIYFAVIYQDNQVFSQKLIMLK
jgi:hypothetical protein